MKKINKKLSLLALLSVSLTAPTQAEFNFKNAIDPMVGVGASAMGIYIWTTYLVKEEFLVQSKYPHAQTWYNAMATKYPVAHLDKKLFLQTMLGVSAHAISWCSTFHHIYFPQNALIRINSLYGMIENNQVLSAEDQLFLAKQEFILLHEAGHIEHNDVSKQLTSSALLLGLLGGSIDKNLYKQYDPQLNIQIQKKSESKIQELQPIDHLNSESKIQELQPTDHLNSESKIQELQPTDPLNNEKVELLINAAQKQAELSLAHRNIRLSAENGISFAHEINTNTCDSKEQLEVTISSNYDNSITLNAPAEFNASYTITESLVLGTVTTVMIHLLLSRHCERNADAFAYTHGDDNALMGGIAFFESEMVDPLFGIEKKDPSPYLETESTIGTIAQSVVSAIESPIFYIDKGISSLINSTSFTRWIYDVTRDVKHPGGPVRAQAIRDELERRSQARP